jgi:putative DNA primase/helicase
VQPKRRTVDEALGRWRDILLSLGVEAKFLQKGHTSCPICNGGKDRYRFTDLNGKGGWICNQCGNGDGVDLLQKMYGWDWKRTMSEIDRVIGTARLQPVHDKQNEEEVKQRIRMRLEEAQFVERGDPVWTYLNRRTGIENVPPSIRYHPALWHSDEKKRFPAMLAVMQYADGKGASVHRTYLTPEGGKAPIEKAKKLMQGLSINGSCVRLSGVRPVIGIAEGIETALAASVMFGFPVWAASNASVMEKWEPPAGIEEVIVCADNDVSFTGQKAAFNLANRLKLKGLEVSVKVPPEAGMDWADLRTAELADSPL